MQHMTIAPNTGFGVIATSARSQAATMVLTPGESTGGPDNRHAASDQWLYVTAGRGYAVVESQRVRLEPGSLLLIEAGEGHEIVNDGDLPLESLNIYAPPEY